MKNSMKNEDHTAEIKGKGFRPKCFLGLLILIVTAVLITFLTYQSNANKAGVADFQLTMYQGSAITGNQPRFTELLESKQPLVLNFWAGLCPPCREEIPGLQKVYNDMGDDFLLVGIDIGPFVGLGSTEDAKKFLREFNISYPTGVPTNASLIQDYNVVGMPTTLFITAKGKIADRHTGYLAEEIARRKVSELIGIK